MLKGWVSPYWQAVCQPEKWDICGVVVNPLSVWHTFALENIGCRYMFEKAKTDLDDAASLLLFCEGNMERGLKLMRYAKYRAKRMEAMHKKLAKLNADDLGVACKDYVTTCLRVPRRFTPSDTTPSVQRVPDALHIVRALCGEYGCSLEDAWNMPYSYGRMLFDGYAAANGDTSIASLAAEAVADRNIELGIDPWTGNRTDPETGITYDPEGNVIDDGSNSET